jgi:sirohydrochlorin cobaltochelatase
MKKFKLVWLAALLMASTVGFTACDDDDDKGYDASSSNPAIEVVAKAKKHDTAILLCTFGSTFKESIKTYDNILADYEAAFPDADVYLSFTSRTCVNRVYAETGIDRFPPDLWLQALGGADYKKVAVQSLHVIPGEEFLSLMNTDVKKEFMIKLFPGIQVAKSPCLVYDEDDVEAVSEVLFDHYKDNLSDKKQILLLMGHGNPDKNYNANSKYTEVEEAMQALATNKNVFVGTVDYGDMLFWPLDKDEQPLPTPNAESVYSKLTKYCEDNNLQPSDITISLAPFMSIAGDHAHNDLWGIEDGDDFSAATPGADACWRLKLLKMGFKISTVESHNGSVDKCTINGLGDYPSIRKIWVNHLKDIYNDADEWQTGEDYQ